MLFIRNNLTIFGESFVGTHIIAFCCYYCHKRLSRSERWHISNKHKGTDTLYNSPKHIIPLIMAQIFVSYKRNNKEIVFKIVKRIESRLGVKCWIDVEGIESNSQFVSKICHAIEDAKIVLFMHSAEHHNINYEEDYTIKELNYARHCNKRIILLKIDDAPLKNYFLFEYGNKNYRLASDMDQFEAMLNDIAKWLNIQIPDRTDITDALVLFQRGQKYASEQNYIEAVKFYRMAAEQGNAEAQNSLGYCYGNGLGVEKDLIESAKWHRLSAEQGEVMAQKALGDCYYNGHGVAQDYTEAIKWYKIAKV